MKGFDRVLTLKKPHDFTRANKQNLLSSKLTSHFIAKCPYSPSLKLNLRSTKKNAFQHIYIDSDWRQSLIFFLHFLKKNSFRQSPKTLTIKTSSSVDFDEDIIKCLYHFTKLEELTISTQSNYRISQEEFMNLSKLLRTFKQLKSLHLGIQNFSSTGDEIKNCIRRIPCNQKLRYLGINFPRAVNILETFDAIKNCNALKELNVILDGLIISDSMSNDIYSFFAQCNALEKLKFSITYGNPKLLKIFEHFYTGKLKSLIVKFQRCEDMCHQDVDSLIVALVSNKLKTLVMNFSGSYFTDFSLRKIANSLKSQFEMENFHLIADKTDLTEKSLGLMSQALESMGCVRDLKISLNYCFNISSLSFLADSLKNLPLISKLSFSARKCQNSNDENLVSVFKSLGNLTSLKCFRLELPQIANITDVCCIELVNSLKKLKKLENLVLDLYHRKVTSKGLKGLPEALRDMKEVEGMAINFAGANMGEELLSSLYDSIKLMKKLDVVHLILNNRDGTEENRVKQTEMLGMDELKLLQFYVYLD